MYSFRDRSKAARKYRVRQMNANLAISGRNPDPEFEMLLEQWIDEEVPQDEAVRRITAMAGLPIDR